MPGWLTGMTSNLQAICGMTRRRSYHANPGQPWDRQQWPSMAAGEDCVQAQVGGVNILAGEGAAEYFEEVRVPRD